MPPSSLFFFLFQGGLGFRASFLWWRGAWRGRVGFRGLGFWAWGFSLSLGCVVSRVSM